MSSLRLFGDGTPVMRIGHALGTALFRFWEPANISRKDRIGLRNIPQPGRDVVETNEASTALLCRGRFAASKETTRPGLAHLSEDFQVRAKLGDETRVLRLSERSAVHARDRG